ncbi:unnamed protein product [marine sediment metagenome]|uniref:Uncharacterized protein n=1 Tax=marine sediment metagenome TaxID=412755 RepID=X0ZER3_9ZZZZ
MEPITHPDHCTDHLEWNESYYFVFYDKQNSLGGMTRLGFKPNKEEGMSFFFLFLPNGSAAGYFREQKVKDYNKILKVGGVCHNYQTKKLCIKEKEAVYILFVDMYVINYAGNLIDAGGVSALSTLISAHIPEGIWNEEKHETEWTGKYLTGKTLVNELPFVITYGKIEDIVFLDPNLPEELVCDGKISISVTEDKVTSIQKSGVATFTIDEIKTLGSKSLEIGKKLRKELNLLQYLSKIE